MSQFVSGLSKEEAAAQSTAWFVLRNKTRLRIIQLLGKYGGQLCVVEIAEVLDEHPSVILGHLAVLRAVRLVTREYFGAYAYYQLTADAVSRYRQLLASL
jgi:DNA-binding transcriptional ArsR family regulator